MTCARTWFQASTAGSADRRQPAALRRRVRWSTRGRRGRQPELQPWRAKELDVGYEWYGGKASYFALHGFYMWLDNYIYTQALAVDFTGLTPPPDQISQISRPNAMDAPSARSAVLPRRPMGKGGWIRGVEVSGAFEFGGLAARSRRLRRDGQHLLHRLQARPGGRQRRRRRAPGLLEMGLRRRPAITRRTASRRAPPIVTARRSRAKSSRSSRNLGFPLILAGQAARRADRLHVPAGFEVEWLGILLQVSNVLNSPYRTYLPTGPNGTNDARRR